MNLNKNVLPLKDALTVASSSVSPTELALRGEGWKAEISRLTGMDIDEVTEMIENGMIDDYLSEGFYALSMKAINASIEAIENDEMPAEKLPDIAAKAGDMALKMRGKDVKKHLFLSADLWQREAEEAVKEVIDL